jgi:uncharacterized Zn finger protein
MITCPRCGQDYVVNAVIRPLNEPIKICPECDSIWRGDLPVRLDTYQVYGAYMESNGLKGVWDFLEILDKA